MRITIDYTPAVRQTAGIGRFARGLIAALLALDHENEYTLFCAGEAPQNTRWPANVSVRTSSVPARLLTAGWYKLGFPLTVERLAGECDIFHSLDYTLPPLRAARGVVTIHDLSFLRLPQYADPALREHLGRSVPGAVARASRVLADSANTQTDLVELLGAAPEKISVVPGGIDPGFRPVRDAVKLAEVQARYKLPQWFVLTVGTIEPRKNMPRLISAYAQLRRQTGLPHALVIAGKDGWLFREVYDQVAKEGLGEHVHFTGFVADEDLPALYTLADLVAFPSLYEGFGLPPLEAMACGTPVVASDNSSLPEAVGTAALMADAENVESLTDALARVLCDANLRVRLSDLGRAQAARFTWERAAQKLLEAYRLTVS